MNDYSNEESFAPRLSRIRTLLFGAAVFVWFAEMVLWGLPSLSAVWTVVSQMIPPEDPQLATALSITHAVRAAAKGALGVMAVFGLRSKNPAARTALFLSMALVFPLNIAFPFRANGFPLGTTVVAAALSAIFWGSFFLFREPAQQSEQRGPGGSSRLPPSRWEIFQYVWFAGNATVLTLLAFLLLFGPRTALGLILPCLPSLPNANEAGLSSLIVSNLLSGTHLLALATASWIAAASCRSNPTLRQAMTAANTLHAGLLVLLPLRQIIAEVGGNCAGSPILVPFAPLFVGWVLYAAFSYRVEPNKRRTTAERVLGEPAAAGSAPTHR